MIDHARSSLDQTGLWCSQFVTQVIKQVYPEALEDVTKVLPKEYHLPYVCTAAFIYYLSFLSNRENEFFRVKCSNADNMTSGSFLFRYTTDHDLQDIRPVPRGMHAMIIDRVIRNTKIDEQISHIVVQVIESSKLDEQNVEQPYHCVRFNQLILLMENGEITSYAHPCKPNNFLKRKFMLAELR